MTSVSRCCRAWLSFLLLQDMGVIWMCYNDQAALLFKAASPIIARQYSVAVALICVLRMSLLCYFDSWPLHFCHIMMTTLYSLSMVAEMYYFKTMLSAVPNIVRVVVQVITIIVLATSQQWLSTPPPDRQQRRSGRLFAKHYMEGDLLTPPETDDVRELRKKQS
ncbi:unnamed protein product [Heligmosomoides polygyrus]|uniref:PhoLip_ATPase_C domain-containing protein n=1 Tax=Heligmosomoides polygyrus TaxID=6339 RepID=A0A183FHZ7_HELPZ|nr:unnamed protein product [Heligmosomoides polygyrus]